MLDLQDAADRLVRQTCATVGQRIIDIPPGMSTGERVEWIAERVAQLGVVPDHPPWTGERTRGTIEQASGTDGWTRGTDGQTSVRPSHEG